MVEMSYWSVSRGGGHLSFEMWVVCHLGCGSFVIGDVGHFPSRMWVICHLGCGSFAVKDVGHLPLGCGSFAIREVDHVVCNVCHLPSWMWVILSFGMWVIDCLECWSFVVWSVAHLSFGMCGLFEIWVYFCWEYKSAVFFMLLM